MVTEPPGAARRETTAGAAPRRLELDDAGRIEAARAARPGAESDEGRLNPGRAVAGRVHVVLRERHRPKRARET